MRRGIAGCGALLALALASTPAEAEIRRVEEIGTVPIRADAPGGGSARDAALQGALRSAVVRVAESFLLDSEPTMGPDGQEVDLDAVLGERMVPYTTRFRVLEDRGERPAMFAEEGASTEYVVVVEVFVDAERIEQRLLDAGLLERDPLAGEVSLIELELQGLERYGALAAVRTLLTERLGASAALPLSFTRGVAVLEVELPGIGADASEVAAQLEDLGPPELLIRSLEADPDRAVLDVTWRPAEDSGDGAAAGAR